MIQERAPKRGRIHSRAVIFDSHHYAAGAARMPCALMRGYLGTDLMAHTRVEPVTCP